MPILQSRGWKALETTDLIGRNRKVTVTGEAQVSRADETPKLAEAVQGINSTILLLEWSTETTGDVGADVVSWKDVCFERPVEEGEFAQVQVPDHSAFDITVAHS